MADKEEEVGAGSTHIHYPAAKWGRRVFPSISQEVYARGEGEM